MLKFVKNTLFYSILVVWILKKDQGYKIAISFPKYPSIPKNGCIFMNTILCPIVLNCNVHCWKAILMRGEIRLSTLSKIESLWEANQSYCT